MLTGLVGSVEAAPMVEKIEERAELNQVRERFISSACSVHLHDCICMFGLTTLPDSIS